MVTIAATMKTVMSSSTIVRNPFANVNDWMIADGKREMMLAKMSSDMPLPIPRCVMSSPIHMMNAVPAISVIDDDDVGEERGRSTDARRTRNGLAEHAEHGDRLQQGDTERHVARDLRDLALARLAFLGPRFDLRNDTLQQLHDDRGRDVGHDPEREHRELLERAAREETEKAECRRCR